MCFATGSCEPGVTEFYHAGPEESPSMVGRIGGGSTQVLSDIMGAVDQASYKPTTKSVA